MITKEDIQNSYNKVQMIDTLVSIRGPWYKRLWSWIKGLFGYHDTGLIFLTKSRNGRGATIEATWCDGCKRFSRGPYCPNCH